MGVDQVFTPFYFAVRVFVVGRMGGLVYHFREYQYIQCFGQQILLED